MEYVDVDALVVGASSLFLFSILDGCEEEVDATSNCDIAEDETELFDKQQSSTKKKEDMIMEFMLPLSSSYQQPHPMIKNEWKKK